MSAVVKGISLEDMKKLKSRHRPRFTDEQVVEALQYQLSTDCTLEKAAAKFGMTGQTLAKRRDELAAKMGLAETPAAPKAKPPAKSKK